VWEEDFELCWKIIWGNLRDIFFKKVVHSRFIFKNNPIAFFFQFYFRRQNRSKVCFYCARYSVRILYIVFQNIIKSAGFSLSDNPSNPKESHRPTRSFFSKWFRGPPSRSDWLTLSRTLWSSRLSESSDAVCALSWSRALLQTFSQTNYLSLLTAGPNMDPSGPSRQAAFVPFSMTVCLPR